MFFRWSMVTIRHIKKGFIKGRNNVAERLGFGHSEEAAVRKLYRASTGLELSTTDSISTDIACSIRSSMIHGKLEIAFFLGIQKSSLLNYEKEDTAIPIYYCREFGHFAHKNEIAHWYVRFLLNRPRRGNLVSFLCETKCETCGKFLFIFPGPNFKKFSFDTPIPATFLKAYINHQPTCPVCKETTTSPGCSHRILNMEDFQGNAP